MKAVKSAAFGVLAVLAALLLYVVVAGGYILAYSAVWSDRGEAASQAAKRELYADPGAVQLYVDNRQQCRGAEREYYWICGVVIAQPVTGRYGQCSSSEHPIYSGTLGRDVLGHPMDPDTFSQGLEVSGHGIMPSNAVWFDDEPADRTTPLPLFPTTFDTTQTGRQVVWARQGDLTALLIKGGRFSGSPERSFERETLEEMNASMPRVIFRHPVYPILVDTYASEPDARDWPLVAAAVEADLEASVQSFDPGAHCGAPPDTVQFRFNVASSDSRIRIIRDWQRIRQATPDN
ncbi:hypothetical protein [Tateyamaria sp. syn59]|uniref:hypothetical protein n=1 Tax=Tateyamaria sp. syn59 TaxID=2576942 RepID=UPI0011BE68AC|nr:hypothetical protein [Tateyamaria sp. syn59]